MKSNLDIRKFLGVVIVVCFFLVFKNDKKKLNQELIFSFAEKDNIPMPICEIDTNGLLIYFNKSYIDLVFKPMGVDPDFMIGKTSALLFGKKKDSIYRAHNDIVKKERKVLQFEESGEDRDGIVHTMEITKYPIIIDSTVVAIGVIAHYKF